MVFFGAVVRPRLGVIIDAFFYSPSYISETLDRGSPDFHWQDHGPVVRSVPNRDLWNAIDAHVITDADGWMAFGSFWGGLKLVKLAPDRL